MDKIALFSQILSKKPNDTFTRYALAIELVARGRVDDGLSQFNTIIAENPDYVPAYQMSAQTMIKANRTGVAFERLEAGIAAAARTGNRKAFAELQAMLDDIS
jgi:predicted Zn-dependent protease